MNHVEQIKARIEEIELKWSTGSQESIDAISIPTLLTALEMAVEALQNCQNAFGTPDDDDYATTEAREALADIANLLKGEK